MLKWTTFRTLWHSIFYNGKLLLQIWITLTLICLLLAKDCFKIIQWSSRRLKQRYFWIVRELCGENLWQALLEGDESENFKPLIFHSKDNGIYMCHSCKDLNKSFLLSKPFNLKTPIRKSLNDSANNAEYMLNNQIASSRVLSIGNFGKESSETRNTFCKDKTYASVCCQCTPTNILNKQNLLSYNNEYNYSKNRNRVEFNERQNILKEASTSPMDCQDVTPEYVKFNNQINDVERKKSKSETKLKSTSKKIPLNSPACLMPILETPVKELNSLPRKSRLELMFSSEKKLEISPEKESVFIRNLHKWKNFRLHFKKRNAGENIEVKSDQTTQIEPDLHEEKSGAIITMQSPEVNNNCCGIMLCRLKTKFNQNAQESSVTYKRFQ